MTALVGRVGAVRRDADRPRARGALRLDVHADLASVEATWRALEAPAASAASALPAPAVLTPYQRFDWVAAYLGTIGAEAGLRPRIVTLRDGAGRARLLLPLAMRTGGRTGGRMGASIGTRLGAGVPRLAAVVGGKHANFHLPLIAADASGEEAVDLLAALPRLLREASSRLEADAVRLALMPGQWNGLANPLARGAPSAASSAYAAGLAPEPDDAVRGAFSAAARRKLRQKEQRLAAVLGPLEHRVAASEAEVEEWLDDLHALKAARFRALGLPNPFGSAAARAFLRGGCLAGLARGTSALELHALVAGGRVLSLYLGAVTAHRFSGMVTAFDPDPAIARASPGDQLLRRLVADQARRGRTVLDLGVGEARYKTSVCDEVIPLYDRVIPLTVRGAALAGVMHAGFRLRGRARRTAWAWSLLRRLPRA